MSSAKAKQRAVALGRLADFAVMYGEPGEVPGGGAAN